MADEKFKLPRSSYEELIKIIKAYGRSNGEVSIDDIAQLSGIGRTRVSANNAFLVGAEIVEGGRKKSTTNKGRELAHALEHEIEEEVSRAWRTVVLENDFLNKMVQAVSVRKGMELSHLENHIAYSAGEGKSTQVMTGARTIVEILQTSGLVEDNDGKIVPNSQSSSTNVPTTLLEVPITTGPTSTDSNIVVHRDAIYDISPNSSGISLHVELRINASVNELDGLGEKLKELMQSLSMTAKEENRKYSQ